MGYSARILADSISDPMVRLTTMEITYPRFVHAEFMTHRVFSRNSASSRAIPIEKLIERVIEDPVIPVWWGKNQKGMQANEELTPEEQARAVLRWLNARDEAVGQARSLAALGVHKQLVNRLIEPWMWITVICTATDWGNFFNLRCHPAAQPEIRKIAEMMRDIYYGSEPTYVPTGGWHLPLLRDQDRELPIEQQKAVSAAKCARVSYLTHDGRRDISEDLRLHDQLVASGHWSPFEHVAKALPHYAYVVYTGNFRAWEQYRKGFQNENRHEYTPVGSAE